MRIQHNILAMNSYRNYSNNTSALGKNLEKLSSGYKINRAGDDAAGLAISEKMRAQIQGLNAAQKNVKDAISFVKTAEGAMQEIQDMLSRMKYLATQSANGTYQNEVDREALQDEVDSLREEINRIAQAANFNGIYMLNGGGDDDSTDELNTADPTVAFEGSVFATNASEPVTFAFGTGVSDEVKAAINKALAEGAKFTVQATLTASGTLGSGDTITVNFDELLKALGEGYKVTYKDVKDNDIEVTGDKEITVATASATTAEAIASGAASIEFTISDAEGNKVGTISINVADLVSGTGSVTLSAGESEEDETVTSTTYTAKVVATSGSDLASIDVASGDSITIGGKTYNVVASASASEGVSFGSNEVTNVKELIEAAIELYNADEDEAFTAEFDADTGEIKFTLKEGVEDPGEPAFSLTVAGGGFEEIEFEKTEPEDGDGNGSGNGGTVYSIDMQIGDSSASFDTMTLEIESMRTSNLIDEKTGKSIDDISIASLDSAHAAIDVIKAAINKVSSVRGQLGAYQNRLEHTQNNLSVMTENIQDAESTIRDTDVADEMMAYVKNNILVQSAQAMLAQANQVPQGVLQLLG